MNSVIFYSLLLFIIISIFMPSIYNYAYHFVIGRILIIILLLYFTKQNIFLGLIFITMVITYSYPLYEGFSNMGKVKLITDNTKPKNVNDENDVYNYFSNYYCTDPNKVNRWQNILNNSNSSSDEYAVANYHMTNYNSLCNGNGTYNNNYYAALDQQEIQWNADSWFSNSDLLSGNYAGYDNLYNSIFTPIDACSQNNNPSTYAYNNPQCLFENLNSFACNNSNVITPATNVSNNVGLDMKTQQDGQFILNTNSWFCQQ